MQHSRGTGDRATAGRLYANATPLCGFSTHRPRGSLAPKKEDCPRLGGKPGGVPAHTARALRVVTGSTRGRQGRRAGERPRSYARARAREGGPDSGGVWRRALGSKSLRCALSRRATHPRIARSGRGFWAVFGRFQRWPKVAMDLPKSDPKFGPKRSVTERNEARREGITSAAKRLKIACFVTSRDGTGCSQSLNNYGKVLKTELRGLLMEPAGGN
jgi:hypothetical protein